ncbi:unnamed protein product [Plutella xylostella]|uniref:(diamondback moth) hypothetical protein n=1 Tax=Plutella xylostella TaxID=51655 RepID=A0A8S4EKL6_PLUXY|nr:unnamed protein product [Plutella xylostella]
MSTRQRRRVRETASVHFYSEHRDAAYGVTLDANYGVNRRPRPYPVMDVNVAEDPDGGTTSTGFCLSGRKKHRIGNGESRRAIQVSFYTTSLDGAEFKSKNVNIAGSGASS